MIMLTKIENMIELKNNTSTTHRSDIIYRTTRSAAVSAHTGLINPSTLHSASCEPLSVIYVLKCAPVLIRMSATYSSCTDICGIIKCD